MFKFLTATLIIALSFCGCISCGGTSEPNIRTQPGIEYCPAFCANMEAQKCTGYYEPINMPLEDGGTQILSCVEFCKYEMQNSVQLNPQCGATAKCADVEKCIK